MVECEHEEKKKIGIAFDCCSIYECVACGALSKQPPISDEEATVVIEDYLKKVITEDRPRLDILDIYCDLELPPDQIIRVMESLGITAKNTEGFDEGNQV